MEIDKDVVLMTARLAGIALTPDEEESLVADIISILRHFTMLAEVDTTNVEASPYIGDLQNIMRPDEISPSNSVEDLLRNAPAREGNWIRTQSAFEEQE